MISANKVFQNCKLDIHFWVIGLFCGTFILSCVPIDQSDPKLFQPLNISFGAMQTNPFSLQKVNDYGGLDVNSTPALADIDNDGDLDLFSGERTGYTRYLENITSTPGNHTFATPITNTFGINTVSNFTRVTVVDFDANGVKDVIIGNNNGYFSYFKNTGTQSSPSFTIQTGGQNPLDGRTPANGAAPAFADLDGDGDLDLLAGQWQGHFYYFQNTGTNTSPVYPESGEQNPFSLTQIVGYSHPSFGDLDQDGDLDLVVGSSTGDLYFFRNIGSSTSPAFGAAQINPFGLTNIGKQQSTPVLVDFDNDGDLDLFVGDIEGNIKYFMNTSL